MNKNKPFMGTYGSENSKEVTSGSHNFMWYGMVAYQWYHQTFSEIRNTIKELQDIVDMKVELLGKARSIIEDFDWSHMMSDSSEPTTAQRKREANLNTLLLECPEHLKQDIYKIFIRSYLDYSINGLSPISYAEFCKGVSI